MHRSNDQNPSFFLSFGDIHRQQTYYIMLKTTMLETYENNKILKVKSIPHALNKTTTLYTAEGK